jgi:hypothetical protein
MARHLSSGSSLLDMVEMVIVMDAAFLLELGIFG